MKCIQDLGTIPDDELLRRLAALLVDSRRTEADLVVHVAEVDARRLDAMPGSPSPALRLDGVVSNRLHGVVAHPPTIQPLSPARYKIQFTASAELRDKLERLRDLMRSSVPDGDLAAVIDAAVTEKLDRLEARRFGRTKRPRKTLSETDTAPRTRGIPAAVKRTVEARDEGRCAYVDEQGRRCPARVSLQLHHRHTFATGGDHSPANVSLLCRGHNRYLAEIDYGRERWPDITGRARGLDPIISGESGANGGALRGWRGGALVRGWARSKARLPRKPGRPQPARPSASARPPTEPGETAGLARSWRAPYPD